MKKRIILWFLLLCWMGVIFLFSTQNGDASGQLSSGILQRFILIVLPKKAAQNSQLVRTLEFLLRKGAHMTEYGILAILAFAQLRQYFPAVFSKDNAVRTERNTPGATLFSRPFFQLLLVLCFTFLYACTDEFHQRFVSGRCGQFRDVLIDSLGGLIGGLLFLLLSQLVQRRKNLTKTNI